MKTPLQCKEDLAPLLDKIDNSRDKAIIALISDSGLYLDELRFLTPKQIKNNQLQTPSPRPRKISLSSFSQPYLAQWLKDRPKTQHPTLFTSLTGTPTTLSQRGIDNIIRKWSSVTNSDLNYQKLRMLAKSPSTIPLKKPSFLPQKTITVSPWSILVGLCSILALSYSLLR